MAFTYSEKLPSTQHTYSLCTCLFRICCSICRAFSEVRPKSSRPDVNRSKRCMVRRFFMLYSLASIKMTVLCLYRPQGCTWADSNWFVLYIKWNNRLLILTGIEAGLLTTKISSSICTILMGCDVTGTSCLWNKIYQLPLGYIVVNSQPLYLCTVLANRSLCFSL